MTGSGSCIIAPTVRIRLDPSNTSNWRPSDDSISPPAFLAGQKVYGIVDVRYNDAACIQPSDSLQVSFVGTHRMKSWSVNHLTGDKWDQRQYSEKIVDVAKTFEVNPESSYSQSNKERRFTFSFQPCDTLTLPVHFGPPGTSDEPLLYEAPQYLYSRSLPSSTYSRFTCPKVKGTYNHNRILEITILYKLHAVLLRPLEVGVVQLAQVTTDITILDGSSGPQPPTCIADFASEYRLMQQTVVTSSKVHAMASRLSRRSCKKPCLFIDASEPQPLIFRRSSQYANTMVPITLTLLQSEDHSNYKVDPPYGYIDVSWCLQKSIFCSFKGMKKPPALKHIASGSKDSPILHKTTRHDKNSYKCGVTYWQEDVSDTLQLKQDSMILLPVGSQENQRDRASFDDSLLPLVKSIFPAKHSPPVVEASPSSVSSDLTTTTTTPPKAAKNKPPEMDIPSCATKTMTISLPIGLPTSHLPTPTSFTSYIATRYSLQLQIHVRFKGVHDHEQNTTRRRNSHWTAEANLGVPIQILYEYEGSESDVMCGQRTGAEPQTDSVDRTKVIAQAMEKLPTYRDSTGCTMAGLEIWCIR